MLRPAGLPGSQPAEEALPILGPARRVLRLKGLENETSGGEKSLPLCAQAMTPGPGRGEKSGSVFSAQLLGKIPPGPAEQVVRRFRYLGWWAKPRVKRKQPGPPSLLCQLPTVKSMGRQHSSACHIYPLEVDTRNLLDLIRTIHFSRAGRDQCLQSKDYKADQASH